MNPNAHHLAEMAHQKESPPFVGSSTYISFAFFREDSQSSGGTQEIKEQPVKFETYKHIG